MEVIPLNAPTPQVVLHLTHWISLVADYLEKFGAAWLVMSRVYVLPNASCLKCKYLVHLITSASMVRFLWVRVMASCFHPAWPGEEWAGQLVLQLCF